VPVANPASFRAEARWQIACAACGAVGVPFHAHHVVDKQTLKSWGISGHALYDTRNAMRLCEGLDTRKCHMRFEKKVAGYEIPLTALSDENIEYAFEVGGLRAYDYLHREYAGPDLRCERKLRELEQAA
jgi:hypothetical protein